MKTKVMKADQVRSMWPDVVDQVSADNCVVLVERYKKPVVAVISYEAFLILQQHIEEYIEDLEEAKKALADYQLDPSRATPIEDLIARWKHEDEGTAASNQL